MFEDENALYEADFFAISRHCGLFCNRYLFDRPLAHNSKIKACRLLRLECF